MTEKTAVYLITKKDFSKYSLDNVTNINIFKIFSFVVEKTVYFLEGFFRVEILCIQ